ncbi:MAG: HPF/RaiA family ribosome-associated protein [Phycisphaerales bacterium JB043]
MRLQIVTRNLPSSHALRSYISNRLSHTVDHLSHRIRSVTVRLKDTNGPRGGIDKLCTMHVELHPSGTVTIHDRDEDYYRLIDKSSKKLKRAMGRFVARRVAKRSRR